MSRQTAILHVMNPLYFKHLSIEVTRRCKGTDAPCPPMGDAGIRDIEHRHIRNILKNAKYIQRFDITGGEPALNPKAIRYILKLLVRQDIQVGEFHVITQGPPAFASEKLIGISIALLEFLDAQKHENGVDGHNAILDRTSNYARDKEVTAVIKRGSSRVVLRFRENCEELRSQSDYPVYLTSDNQVCSHIRLDAEGMISGTGMPFERDAPYPVLCPSNHFIRYLKSTRHKGACGMKRANRGKKKRRSGKPQV